MSRASYHDAGPCSRSEEDFVTEEQLEVARNGVVHQASRRGKADRFVLSSATKSSPDRNRTGRPRERHEPLLALVDHNSYVEGSFNLSCRLRMSGT